MRRSHRLRSGAAILAAGGLLAGVALAAPGSAAAAPGADDASGAQTSTPIKHLVVIYGENVSFDHYFGTYPNAANPPGEPQFHAAAGTPDVNGLSQTLLNHNPNLANPQRLNPSQALTCDQDHGYTAEQLAFDHGLMDKFVQNTNDGHSTTPLTLSQCLAAVHNPAPATGSNPNYPVMDYYDGNTVTGLWNYAQHYAMSDNAYGTGFGPSTPGALAVAAGTTYGATCGPPGAVYSPGGTLPPCVSGPGGVPYTTQATPGQSTGAGTGTDYNDRDPYYDACSTNYGGSGNQTIAMGGKNIGDLLNADHLTWGWFQGGFAPTSRNANGTPACAQSHRNVGGATITDYVPHREPFQYYPQTANPLHLPPTSTAMIGHQDRANHQYDLTNFWAAAGSGNMPAVSYLKAGDYQSGHAGSSDPLDEQRFVADTINRLESLKSWQSTAVIVTYDDSDGWYDHQMSSIVNQSQTSLDMLSGAGECGTTTTAVPMTGNGQPEQARCGYGPRLPFLVISPWSKTNYVSNTTVDQSSVIRFVEDNWHLGTIGNGSADSEAGSILPMLNFGQHPNQALYLNPTTGEPLQGEPHPSRSEN